MVLKQLAVEVTTAVLAVSKRERGRPLVVRGEIALLREAGTRCAPA